MGLPCRGMKIQNRKGFEVQTMDEGLQSMADEDSSLVQEPSAGDGNVPVIYMTTEISPESLIGRFTGNLSICSQTALRSTWGSHSMISSSWTCRR